MAEYHNTRDAGCKIEHKFGDHYVKTEFPCAIVVLPSSAVGGIRVGTIFQPFLPSFLASPPAGFRFAVTSGRASGGMKSAAATAPFLRASNLSWHEIEIEYARHLRRLA